MTDGVLLVGASGLAREVIAAGMTGIVGILDDAVELRDESMGGVPVLGPVASAASHTEQLLLCIGPSAVRRRVAQRLGRAGVTADRYATFVARSARLGRTVEVGPGSIVLDGVVATADAVLGRHVVVMPNCTITHDDVIEDFATLTSGVSLAGGVSVGEAVYIGMNAAVRQGLRLGAGATVGMGAVVLGDVPPGETWAGNPARRLGESL
ncbi:NeuD/PglB/VioB family sugar acetyltransferase [Microbacterium sp. 10M-3C3]|jgi:sugar O-acyltransferase (sialic acid O-acetyltransferase NeuD family)|uniref:NeuD/PglB/VioB family sugar acetyltransferase n=1 Tax=Microbacterium sp. 10M-3C3 TaxID=2483401 RepID=UPI000F62F248|nr:NeuD/PglB/VioB family sugar acetyltransferase [Microbacterium sp. 10M-3C3]